MIAFFEERRGRLHGFRFKDWSDYKSCAPSETLSALDQAIGTGDGAMAAFQLTKTYGSAYAPWARADQEARLGDGDCRRRRRDED